MSLRDRITAAREQTARIAVLDEYARLSQAHDHHAELAHLFDQPGSRMSFEWASEMCLRAWRAERDDPRPEGVL